MNDLRSPILAIGVRVVGPLAVILAAYLFFAGHNQPGGGFAAGLVLGSVVALRILAGMRPPVDAVTAMAVGAVTCGAVALAPVLVGEALLDQVVLEGTVPVLGKVKSGSAAVFDLGVTLIVVGLIVAVLEGLGTFGGDAVSAAADDGADGRAPVEGEVVR